MYNTVPNHARPLSLNLVNNAMLRHLDGEDEQHSITVTNWPLPLNKVVRKGQSLTRVL